MNPRIAITGIGIVSPFGIGRERFWSAVSRGCSGTRAITDFDASSLPCRVAAPVPPLTLADIPPLDGDDDGESHADPRRYSRAALIGVIAAREAWTDAGLCAGEPRAGVVIGSGGGGVEIGERQYEDFFLNGGKHVTPYAVALGIVGMVSSELSISLRLHGVSHVLSTGCTSSTDAIGYACSSLRNGEADMILSGGVDAPVTPGMIFGFSRMRAVSTRYNDRPAHASRPFDRGRDGFVLGEGAWLFVLEREDRAVARRTNIYACIEGYGSTCDAYHRVQMAADGEHIVRAMRLAVERSGRTVDEIGYVNYHGTSTVLNDVVEARCVRQFLSRRADSVPGSSTKSMIGHPQGASGAAGVATTALALSRHFLPPTINLSDPDPACELDFIANVGRHDSPRTALCNCLGFGSKNSALVLSAAQ